MNLTFQGGGLGPRARLCHAIEEASICRSYLVADEFFEQEQGEGVSGPLGRTRNKLENGLHILKAAKWGLTHSRSDADYWEKKLD